MTSEINELSFGWNLPVIWYDDDDDDDDDDDIVSEIVPEPRAGSGSSK